MKRLKKGLTQMWFDQTRLDQSKEHKDHKAKKEELKILTGNLACSIPKEGGKASYS